MKKKRMFVRVFTLCLAMMMSLALSISASADGYTEYPEPQAYSDSEYQLTGAKSASYGYDIIYTYDAAGRLSKEENRRDGSLYSTTTYTYDADGRLTQEKYVEVSRGYFFSDHTIAYSYNAAGQCIKKMTDYEDDKLADREELYAYDASGKLLTSHVYQIEGNLLVDSTQYVYDQAGRLIETRDADTGDALMTYTYNASGQLIREEGSPYFPEWLSYTYNSNGQRIKAEGPEGYWVEYTYDSNGNHIKSVNAYGETEEYTYALRQDISGLPFHDVAASQYYYEAVKWAVDEDITSGTSATTFSPNDTCTRGQVVTFLWRANGSPEPRTASNPFTDVSAGDYYCKAVLWAYENNITSGTSGTTFSPAASCTRGQVVTFLWRTANSPAATGSTAFTDVSAGQYYYDAVRWAVANDITSGTSGTTFSPASNCTRGQIVTFLWRASV